ncbi:MAG: type II CAAX endopeptidase family protein [Rhizomicrobium sp.]|jgi:hypothetical protein
MTITSGLKRAGLALVLCIAIYAPAFATLAWLHHQHLLCALGHKPLCPSIQAAIVLITAISAGVAALLVLVFARRPRGVAEFGVAGSRISHLVVALLVGGVGGGLAAYFSARYPGSSPLELSQLSPTFRYVCFLLAAPIQEELIFRGVLQTMIARAVAETKAFWPAHFPVIFVALLFGILHLGSGLVVAAGALLLGLIAGELRRISGSLLPAIIVHALFNAMSFWLAP